MCVGKMTAMEQMAHSNTGQTRLSEALSIEMCEQMTERRQEHVQY